MGKSSRAKGARGEREFAKLLRVSGVDPDAERGVQRKGGPESPDIKTSLPIHFEVKRVEASQFPKWMQQAQDECGTEKIPLVAHRRSGSDWHAYLTMGDFLAILDCVDMERLEDIYGYSGQGVRK